MSLAYVEKLNRADSRGGEGRFTITDAIVRPVELSDVVAWLEEHHGAKRVEARRMSFVYDKPDWWLDDVRVDAEGTYLVVRVSDD